MALPDRSSPFATYAWSSPPPRRRVDPIEQQGTGAIFGVLLLVITFGLGGVVGYVIGRAL